MKKQGSLFIVATPIGNLEDITLRALRTLKEAALIASEDTRQTKKLLNRHKIDTPLISYYREKEAVRAQTILEELDQGRDVALVSDAGTPCISDPGSILIQKAHQAGLTVVPIPGPSALTAAFSMAGMENDHFLFLGFAPSRKGERRKFWQQQGQSRTSLVFYESPRRIIACLEDILDILGDRTIFVVRELTKIHEEYFRGPVSSVLNNLKGKQAVKGEFVAILEGAAPQETAPEDLHELILWYRNQDGATLSGSVKRIAKDLGIPRGKVYKEALTIWDEDDR